MLKAVKARHFHAGDPTPFDVIVLDHAARHLRRKVITLQHGDEVLVDLPDAVSLHHSDRLILDDNRHVEIIAAEERLLSIKGRTAEHHAQLCWHIGNRHLPAQIEEDRILIVSDPVIRNMLEGLSAIIAETSEPFHPVRGAYHKHAHNNGGHSHDH